MVGPGQGNILELVAEGIRCGAPAPGGQMLLPDVPPYRAMDRLGQGRADWLAKHGGEPWWRESATMDQVAAARDAGFVDVRQHGLDGKPYPYVLVATRPHG